MRVFSQINKCQQKKTNKQTNKTQKRGAPLLSLAKSIYYPFEVIILVMDQYGCKHVKHDGHQEFQIELSCQYGLMLK